MKQKRAKRGFALVMALYLTAVVFVLGTFFIADQLNKNRSVSDYKNAKTALEAANMGLNYILNYMGDINNHWADALLLASNANGAVSPICAGQTAEFLAWPSPANSGAPMYTFTITAGPGNPPSPGHPSQFLTGKQSPESADPNLYENDYQFGIDQTVVTSAAENTGAEISGILQIFYNKNLAPGETCGSVPGPATDPYAITNIKITITSAIYHLAGGKTAGPPLAIRQIQWTGLRNIGLFSAKYQCWVCWDVAGNKYPNATEQTDSSSYIGNGFQSNGSDFALATTSTTQDHQASPLVSYQSLYGINHNGVMLINETNPSPLSAPQLYGTSIGYNQPDTRINNSEASCCLNGKSSVTKNSQSFITGIPFGAASGNLATMTDNSSGTLTAPQVLLTDYNSAASDSGCSGSVKTVFIASSASAGAGIQSTGTLSSAGYDYEFDASGAHQTLEPAVADVTFNGGGSNTVSIKTIGYYSGQVIQQYHNMPISSIQNGILYFDGFKNVRVHGQNQLAGASLTVVADQGEGFYSNTGANITPGYNSSTGNLNTPTACIASNPSLSNSAYNVPQYAQNYQSNVGAGMTSPTGAPLSGHDYWIPGQTQSTANLKDGIYYDSSGNTIGYHVDDVNGRPLTLNPTLTNCVSNCTSTGITSNTGASVPVIKTSDTNNFYSTVFLPPPAQDQNGNIINPNSGNLPVTALSGATALVPAQVELVDSNGNVVASKFMAPYPGASALNDLIANPNQTPDNLFYTRQFEQSEGNLTVAGDTGFQGQGSSLGLMARNYVVLNDFTAASKSANSDYTLQVNANIVSTDKSMQWEGLVAQDQNSKYAQDVYLNGDYAALYNGLQGGPQNPFYYTDQTGAARSAYGDSWQGAPIPEPGKGVVSPVTSQPNPAQGKWWQFQLYGSTQAEYQDVVNTQDSNGNYLGYAKERFDLNQSNLYGPSPGFPIMSFEQYQTLGLPAAYITLSYNDLGSLQSYGP